MSKESLFGNDLRRFWSLTYTLAATDFKLRFFGSTLGYFWSLARPLMLFGTLYVVFTHVFRLGGDIKFYPAYLLTSLLLWTYFAEATGAGVSCLIARENLLRKMRFPKLVIPVSVVLTSLFNLAANMLAVAVFIFVTGIKPQLGWLLFPLIVLFLTVLILGIVMILSALYVSYRDIDPIWDVLRQILFYASPILFAATTYPATAQAWMMINPIAFVTTAMRHYLIDPSAPTPGDLIGGNIYLLAPLLITCFIVWIGLVIFKRASPKIAEKL